MNQEEEKKEDGTTANAEQTATETKEEAPKSDASQSESTKTDTASGTDKEQKTEEKSWKTEENARYAQMRRENEELKKRLDAMQSEKRENITEQALKDLGLTRDDLKDEDNMAIASEYTKALAKGEQDPIAYAYKTAYKRTQEAKRKASEETAKEAKAKEETAKKVRADADSFKERYPNVNINDLVKEGSEFNELFGDVPDIIGNVTKYYGKYLKMKGDTAQTKKTTEADKAKSQPYTGGNNSNSDGGRKLTKDEILRLPQKEYDAYMAKLRSHRH